jgi:hypothetical protein
MRSSRSLLASAAAVLLLLLSLAAAADMSIVSYGERSEEETRRVYAEWMAQHGRTYNALGEEDRRFQVFRDNLRYIDQHNTAADAGLHSFRLGLNRFADITNEEYRARYLGVRSKPERQRKLSARYQADDSEELPESFDWREKGAVVEVKDQGDCGEHPRLNLLLLLPSLLFFQIIKFVATILHCHHKPKSGPYSTSCNKLVDLPARYSYKYVMKTN